MANIWLMQAHCLKCQPEFAINVCGWYYENYGRYCSAGDNGRWSKNKLEKQFPLTCWTLTTCWRFPAALSASTIYIPVELNQKLCLLFQKHCKPEWYYFAYLAAGTMVLALSCYLAGQLVHVDRCFDDIRPTSTHKVAGLNKFIK